MSTYSTWTCLQVKARSQHDMSFRPVGWFHFSIVTAHKFFGATPQLQRKNGPPKPRSSCCTSAPPQNHHPADWWGNQKGTFWFIGLLLKLNSPLLLPGIFRKVRYCFLFLTKIGESSWWSLLVQDHQKLRRKKQTSRSENAMEWYKLMVPV